MTAFAQLYLLFSASFASLRELVFIPLKVLSSQEEALTECPRGVGWFRPFYLAFDAVSGESQFNVAK